MDKKKIRDFIAQFLRYGDIGGAQWNRIYNVIATILLVSVWLTQRNIIIPFKYLIIIAIAMKFGFTLLGYMWVKLGFLEKEIKIDAEANPVLREIRKGDQKILDAIEEIK